MYPRSALKFHFISKALDWGAPRRMQFDTLFDNLLVQMIQIHY